MAPTSTFLLLIIGVTVVMFNAKTQAAVLKCGPNQIYDSCGTRCPATCSNLDTTEMCTDDCVPGCYCINGYVFLTDKDGTCVPPQECPQYN
ncbi:chymotrypsin inhibitor-like [Pyxicephalus adspersus]|uniref:chymotrypsin inhibitor-like n=1 Tax=Pyxicephalus adspersus TaxID=30357 RepID=UPI003B5A79D4